MTKEEAKEIIKNIDYAYRSFRPHEYEALEMAIKALEQEPTNKIVQKAYEDGKKDGYVQAKVEQEPKTDTLDKIRAEIEALNPLNYVYLSSYDGHRGASDMKDDILNIIDKYKASPTGVEGGDKE